MIEVVQLAGLSRDDWLEARRAGIGSSDAPAICGLDRFNSPTSVYYDKRGEWVDDSDNEAMEWGRLLEEPVAQKFAAVHEFHVEPPSAMYQHDEHPFMLASPDRWVHRLDETEPCAVLEVKTSALRDDWKDGPPERTVVQVQHQLAVTGHTVAHVACLLNGRQYDDWLIERNDELIAALIHIETDFWERVLDGVPPATDGHASTTEALNNVFALAREGAVIELDDDALALHIELAKAKQFEKDAKKDVAELTNAVKARMGDHELALYDGVPLFTWKQQKVKERLHNCPECTHVPERSSRTFLVKKGLAA